MELTNTIKKRIFFFYVLDANKDGILESDDIEEIVNRVIDIRKGYFSKGEQKHLHHQTLKSFDRLLIEATKGKRRNITLLEWVKIIQRYNDEVDRKPYFIRWFSASAILSLASMPDNLFVVISIPLSNMVIWLIFALSLKQGRSTIQEKTDWIV